MNSSSRKSMYSLHDLWGPRRMALSICSVVQGGVVNLTGAPRCLRFISKRRAGWLTLSRLEKSPRPRRCLTKDRHPTRESNSTSRIINSPSSSEVVILLGRLTLARLGDGCGPAGSVRLPLGGGMDGEGCCGVELLLYWGGDRRVESTKGGSSLF